MATDKTAVVTPVVVVRSMQEYLDRYFGPRQSKPDPHAKLPPDQYGALIAQRSLGRVLRDAGRGE